MGKFTTTSLCVSTLLLLLLLASSRVLARRGPAFHDVTPVENSIPDRDELDAADRDNCVGLRDDECMMKKTIEAQLDYIYTQKRRKQP